MRVLIVSLCILLLAYVIKIDLQQGGINYTGIKGTQQCEETFTIEKVSVKVQAGDTLYSMFAATPSYENISMIDRVEWFYDLNPHLKHQSMKIGESVYIPIAGKKTKNC